MIVRFLLLWLAGASLRVTILAVPPLLPAIHHDLGLDEKGVAALTALPLLLLAGAAIPGALLIARVGARRALLGGLLLIAAASAARGLGPSTPVLLAMSFLMGVGVAVCQPALPSLVRRWLPLQVGPATATYANGMVVGEILAVALTAPVVLPLLAKSWELGLAAWALPVLLTALLVLLGSEEAAAEQRGKPTRWWPDWTSRQPWLLGLILGGGSALYFGTNAFIPDFLQATGRAALISAGLTALNGCQLIASLLVATLPRQLVGQRWPLVVAGAFSLLALAGLVFLPGGWALPSLGLLGFCAALVLVLSLALPPLLAAPDDVHRLAAAMFTISYASAFFLPLFGGAAWDASGLPATAFTPALLAALLVLVLPVGLAMPGDQASGSDLMPVPTERSAGE